MTKPLIDLEALKGKVFSSEGVAELLDLTPDSIRRRIRNKQIPARRVPGEKSYAIRGDDLAAYLSGETVEPDRTIPPRPVRPALEPITANALPAVLPKAANSRLKTWMTKRALQQKEVAEKSGMNGGELSRILAGKRGLSRRNAERLRSAYGNGLIQFLIDAKK